MVSIPDFWSRFIRDWKTGCFNWQGPVDAHGYGYARFPKGDRMGVHRIAYLFTYGPIPKNHRVRRTCGNGRCGEQAHVELVRIKKTIVE